MASDCTQCIILKPVWLRALAPLCMACRASVHCPASAAGCGHVTQFWPMTLNGWIMWQPMGNLLERQLVTICPSLCSPAEVLLWPCAAGCASRHLILSRYLRPSRGGAAHSSTSHWGDISLPAAWSQASGPLLYTAALLPDSCIYRRKPSCRQGHLELHSAQERTR